MKFIFTATNKSQAEKFQSHIKTDRSLESTVAEKDGKFLVEYSIPDVSFASTDLIKAEDEEGEKEESVCKEDVQEMLSSLAQYLYKEIQYQFNWIWSEVAYLENAFYKHASNGHLPPIVGADKLQKALEILGVGGDYEVRKSVIYAATKNGTQIDVDITK